MCFYLNIIFKEIMFIEGGEIGIILNILAGLTSEHINIDTMLYLLASSHWAYGGDRYLDSKSTKYVSFMSLLFSICVADYILYANHLVNYVAPTTLCLPLYRPLKTNVPLIKPFIVAGMWSVAVCNLPQDLDHLYNGTHDYITLGAMFLNIFSITNEEDVLDYEEDMINNVKTFPTIIGKRDTLDICKMCVLGSIIIGMYSDHRVLFDVININQTLRLKKTKNKIVNNVKSPRDVNLFLKYLRKLFLNNKVSCGHHI